MPTYWGGVEVTRTSVLFVDGNIDMDGHDIDLGSGKLKTTNLLFKEWTSSIMALRNRADDADKALKLQDVTAGGTGYFTGSVSTGIVSEIVANAGVIIDGLKSKDGSLQGFDAMADADADNDTLYKASDHANVLYYKDSGGTCHALW